MNYQTGVFIECVISILICFCCANLPVESTAHASSWDPFGWWRRSRHIDPVRSTRIPCTSRTFAIAFPSWIPWREIAFPRVALSPCTEYLSPFCRVLPNILSKNRVLPYRNLILERPINYLFWVLKALTVILISKISN